MTTIEEVKQSPMYINEFEEIINATEKILATNKELEAKEIDLGNTPIAPVLIPSNETMVVLNSSATIKYYKLLRLLENEKTSLEYSFVMIGRKLQYDTDETIVIDDIISTDKKTKLSNRETTIDQDLLNKIINKAIKNKASFIGIGHTHPKISDEEKKTTMNNFLSQEVMEKNFVREPGLNFSLADVYNYNNLYEWATPKGIHTGMAVIMYNGEVAMITRDSKKLTRCEEIFDMNSGEEIKTPRLSVGMKL